MSKIKVDVDQQLIEQCMELTGLQTKEAVAEFALGELLRKVNQDKILELQGKVNWEGDLSQMRQTR